MTTTPSPTFMARMTELEDVYLESDDPVEQSGFSGGPSRWWAERSPILAAVDRSGDFLDVGCANGHLLECLCEWSEHEITPHGIDIGEGLIREARRRLPEHADHFRAADAWDWTPTRRYRYVYSIEDLSPPDLTLEWVRRLSRWVEPGGRFILGSYGSRSAGPPEAATRLLEEAGMTVTGAAVGGTPVVAAYAWSDRV